MNTQSNAMPESPVESQAVALTAISPSRRMYWLVLRELWEYRWIYIAPLAAAGVFLFGFLVNMIRLRHRMPHTPAEQHEMFAVPYEFAAALIMGTAFFVGIFYSLDTLYGERRDRSILFWKSLPVSDVMTVLSKVTVPLVILPLLAFAITVAAQIVMLLLSSVVLMGSGLSTTMLWTHSSFFHVSLTLFYHVVTVHGLWYAPLYGWLLLVSAWAPRAPFVWAFLPPFVIYGVEKIAFNTSYFLDMLADRLTGQSSMSMHPQSATIDPWSALIPDQFFSLPGLWIGLAIAAAFLYAAVRVRRYRGPI